MATDAGAADSRPLARRRRWPWRPMLLAVASGMLLYASFPPRPLWFLAPVAVAVLVLTLRSGPSLRGGVGYGMLAGWGFFVPLLPWVGEYVGPVPWLALATACAVYVGLFGLLARLVAELPGWPLWTALAWSLTEWARSAFPFGGFPWGRLAFGQPGGMLLPLARLGGAPLLSFAVALTGTGLAALIHAARARPASPRRISGVAGAAAALLAAPVLGAALWPGTATTADGDRLVTVAAVQGSVPRLGLDFNAQRRAVLDNHVRETLRLAREIESGRTPRPDVVIWPENSSDIDPMRNADAAAEISEAARAVRAPILVGAVLVNDDDTDTNSVIVWNPDTGPAQRHDKKIVQPFGEYLPWRSFFRLFSSYADRAGHFVPGHGDGLVHAAGLPIGVATCYEVAFDRAFAESVRAGAQLLTVPTNNATFGRTEMTYQQLAMSRVRAVEHSRTVVVAATSGVSAIIGPDGSVTQRSELFVPQTLVAHVRLRDGTTLASRLGPASEAVLCAGAGCAVIAALARRGVPTRWTQRRRSAIDSGD
ncbi:MAG: apolipoprotein N-acyltransferase [Streptomycetaceae bacterium]|nr:apolipoprotein N-acyltransferase [Streptomycetaceae bacterium]